MSLPETPSKPEFVADVGGSIRVPFPGEGAGGWPMAALLAFFSVMMGLIPWFAAFAGVAGPGLFHFLRQQSAPKLEFGEDKVVVAANGRTVGVKREELREARVVREGRAWALALQTEQGPIALERTGASPAELQWTADLLEAWRTRAPRAPALRDAVVEETLGTTTFVVSASLSAADIAVVSAILGFGIWLAGWLMVSMDVSSLVVGILASPLAAVMGHLYGSRRTARTEIQVRDQAVLVEKIGGYTEKRTVALEDIVQVRPLKNAVQLILRQGTLSLPAKGCVPALTEAIESRRARLSQATGSADDARERMQQLARLHDKART